MTRSAGLRAVLLLMLCLSGNARAQSTWSGFANVEVHGTLLNGTPGAPLLDINSGWAVRGGVRRGSWGTFLQVEQSLWRGTEYGAHMVPGALNLGIGSELRFANGLVRSSLALGPSLLLFDTQLDKAGHIGVFLDARPLGLRWRLSPHFTLGLDPLSFAIVAPVLSGIPLVRVQYRTTLVMEFDFP
ncbi:hypothetical protein ACN28E_54465 [Archangium lansingense]|uniref:hypothetical protein n=1 Tax=Archangium lansingense TaxID=2995310 RepID=UPI003B81F5A5